MSTTPAEQCSILIVDDMEENLVAFEAVLGPLHQRLVRAQSGEQALKAMLRQEFAVVLLDVRMPGMDGFETAANIKRLDQTKDVPIILVTGTEAGADYAYRGYAIGAADFITKPIDPWVLRTKISVFLDLHRKNRQLALRAVAADTERLTEITERLTRIEVLLRDRREPDADGLADRIAELERSVGTLLPGPVEAE
ncbi:response regulator [Streptomyces chiangmaiensis]|uniref:Response regulator n=1 Tax=Streptomyces chiangmaiensis TaxID=766497 RepID=A0ABU7FCF9_9ACTN|nr:response regulator [Streptomyces chiangmaiensis]MED7821599.1 response regulator [Streptomyces chiangmaiensis]